MHVRIYNESGDRLPPASLGAVGKAAAGALRFPRNTECNIIVLTNSAMRRLNKKTRGKDRTTNVLAFPLHKRRPFRPDADGSLRLGDVYIALPKVRADAMDHGQTVSLEMRHIAVHGILHLAGYRHETEQQARNMDNMADRILRLVK